MGVEALLPWSGFIALGTSNMRGQTIYGMDTCDIMFI